MTQEIETIRESGAVVDVPLNKLKKSPRNARRTPHAEADIEALAASIATKGVLQAPVVEPEAHEIRNALLAVEGIFLLRGLGFVEVVVEEHRSVLLHARDTVAGVLAKRRA